MFHSFIRPQCCCHCNPNQYDVYYNTFVALLSNLSCNKTKNEVLAAQLCDYFDIKKPDNTDDIINLIKSNKVEKEKLDEMLKKTFEAVNGVWREKLVNDEQITAITDMIKGLEKDQTPEKIGESVINLINLFCKSTNV